MLITNHAAALKINWFDDDINGDTKIVDAAIKALSINYYLIVPFFKEIDKYKIKNEKYFLHYLSLKEEKLEPYLKYKDLKHSPSVRYVEAHPDCEDNKKAKYYAIAVDHMLTQKDKKKAYKKCNRWSHKNLEKIYKLSSD